MVCPVFSRPADCWGRPRPCLPINRGIVDTWFHTSRGIMEIPLVVLFLTPHTHPPDGSGHGSCLRCWKNACEWRGIFLRHELTGEFMPSTAARRRGVRGLPAGVRQARPLVCLLPRQSVRGAPSFWWPPWTPLGAGSEIWWWCGHSLPRGSPFCSASFLRLPLPRYLLWASHASSTRSRRSTTSSSSYS